MSRRAKPRTPNTPAAVFTATLQEGGIRTLIYWAKKPWTMSRSENIRLWRTIYMLSRLER